MTVRTARTAGAAVLAALAVFAAGVACGKSIPPPTPPASSSSSDVPSASTQAADPAGPLPVSRVFDGDTLYIRYAGDDSPVRFIGQNSPEVKHPGHAADDCLGAAARQRASDLLVGGVAVLVADPSQGEKDKYGRWLRYVDTPAGVDVSLTLISEGLAHEYTYSRRYERQDAYRAAQDAARAGGRGGWAPLAAGGCAWN